jgi:hypothetical protein
MPVSGVFAVTLLVAFYDIHGIEGELLFFYPGLDTTRDISGFKYVSCGVRDKIKE